MRNEGGAAIEPVAVVSNERVADEVGRIVFDAPRTAASVRPGQFVHLRIARGADFILRRPFSVHRAYDGRLEILYQVVGRGTRVLAEAESGDVMDVIGPLGTGWSVPEGARKALVVAGGLGAAPMGMLVEELAARGVGVTTALGAPRRDACSRGRSSSRYADARSWPPTTARRAHAGWSLSSRPSCWSASVRTSCTRAVLSRCSVWWRRSALRPVWRARCRSSG